MPDKIGQAGQVINFNFVNNFVAENLNRLLYAAFTPGVLKLEYTYVHDSDEIELTEFSALILPKNKNFLVKADLHSSLKIKIDANPYLVAWMDWIEPPSGFVYDSWYYGTSGYSSYSGYYDIPWIACTLDADEDEFTSANHNLEAGDVVRFYSTVGSLSADVNYYVVYVDTDTFQISEESDGDALDLTLSGSTQYRKINSHITRFNMVSEDDYDPTYHVLLGEFKYVTIGSVVHRVFDTLYQSRVYLSDNCINYDKVQWSGVSGWEGVSGYSGYSGPRTLDGSNSTRMGLSGWSGISGVYDETDGTIERYVGHNSGYIPISDTTINLGLNAEKLNNIPAGNNDNSIAVVNGVVCSNLVAARLFLDGVEYGLGQSGLKGYSSFSGYTGWSGFSGESGYRSYVSGYIPISNEILQTKLNAEYLEGYALEDLSASDHTHNIEFLEDGTVFKVLTGVNEDGLVTSAGLQDGVLQYRHQSLTTPFRYDGLVAAKMFALAGQIGRGQSQVVSFRKEFSEKPRVFILNNETDEWKAVNEEDITTVGFEVNWEENTKSDGSDNLVSDTTDFSCYWIAIGQLV
ncbi:MAG: hypothetical protein WC495_05225 [Patescibacteria group bacterium]|jgi:hypothetical protein